MSSRRKFVVWTWMDDNLPMFVGWGRYGQQHPAKKLWAKRAGADSDLNLWLRRFKSEPHRIDHAGDVRYYRHEASSVAKMFRKKYQADGRKLLDPRPWGTKEGGGASRMVISPEFTIFGSVRQAAIDQAVNPCTITRWCQEDGTDWDYLN